jgi:adenine-specific DNA-methyltransferase
MEKTPEEKIDRARTLRRHSTDAEALLWTRLRNRALAGHEFRRQRPVGPYVVDFICLEPHLVVEVDGGQHALRRNEDAVRTKWLEGQGLRVLRFWNHEVLQNLEGVLRMIEQALSERKS